MDWNVINGVLRAVIPAALAYAVGKGWITQSQVGDITAAIITLAAAGWSVKTNVLAHPGSVDFTPTGRKLAIAALALGTLALLGVDARAADVAFKAPPVPRLNVGNYAAGGCGFYYGVNTMGGGGSISGPVGATAIQGDIGATVGYGCPIGTMAGAFWFVEGNFDFANINGSTNGLSMTGPAHFEQRFGAGGPISAMLNSGLFPNLNPGNGLSVPTLPGLPAGLTYGPSYPFLFVSLHEEDVSAQVGAATGRDWVFSPGIGVGLQSRLSNNVVAETAAQWVLRSNGISVGPNKVGFGNGAEVSFTLKY